MTSGLSPRPGVKRGAKRTARPPRSRWPVALLLRRACALALWISEQRHGPTLPDERDDGRYGRDEPGGDDPQQHGELAAHVRHDENVVAPSAAAVTSMRRFGDVEDDDGSGQSSERMELAGTRGPAARCSRRLFRSDAHPRPDRGTFPSMKAQHTIYCGKGHRTLDGVPVAHSCRVLAPEYLEAERREEYGRAASLLERMPLVLHPGVAERAPALSACAIA